MKNTLFPTMAVFLSLVQLTAQAQAQAPLQEEVLQTWDYEIEDQINPRRSTQSLCNDFPMTCRNWLPPPSKQGSDGGGIESLEIPDYQAGSNAYDFGVGDLQKMQIESLQLDQLN